MVIYKAASKFFAFTIMLVGFIVTVHCDDKMNPEEKLAVKKFYSMVKDGFTKEIQHSDKYLIRWIRAKDYDLDAAEQFLRRNFEWRKDNKMDSILSEDFADWEKRAPYNFASHDKEGRPAMVSGLGQFDIRRTVLAGKKEELDRYLVYGFERGLYNVYNVGNQTGKTYIDGYLLFNMAGYSTKAHACLACIPSWLMMVQNYERYYPQLVTNPHNDVAGKLTFQRTQLSVVSFDIGLATGKCHRRRNSSTCNVICDASQIYQNTETFTLRNVSFPNVYAPRVFQALLSILRPLMSPHTAKNIRVYGLDKDEWKRELLKTFPEDQLLLAFGGTLKV